MWCLSNVGLNISTLITRIDSNFLHTCESITALLHFPSNKSCINLYPCYASSSLLQLWKGSTIHECPLSPLQLWKGLIASTKLHTAIVFRITCVDYVSFIHAMHHRPCTNYERDLSSMHMHCPCSNCKRDHYPPYRTLSLVLTTC